MHKETFTYNSERIKTIDYLLKQYTSMDIPASEVTQVKNSIEITPLETATLKQSTIELSVDYDY